MDDTMSTCGPTCCQDTEGTASPPALLGSAAPVDVPFSAEAEAEAERRRLRDAGATVCVDTGTVVTDCGPPTVVDTSVCGSDVICGTDAAACG